MHLPPLTLVFFFFNDTATTEIYTLSLHDALPICSLPRLRLTSARARRSWNSCQPTVSRSTTRRASASMGARGVGGAIAQPARRRRTRALLSGFGALALRTAEPRLRVLDLLLDGVGVRIERQRLLPRGERVFLVAVLGVRVAEVVEDDGVFLGLLDGPLQLPQRVGILALLVVGPAEAVDEVAVVGLEREGLADERDGLVEVLPALGVHVADVVVGLGVLGIDRDDAPEGAHRVVELGLLLEDHPDLEVQVAVLVVEQQALAQRLERAVVLLGAEVRGAEVQEQLRPPWLEVHRLAQHGDRLVEALGAAVEEPQLHACVVAVAEGGPRTVVGGIELHGLGEPPDRLVPALGLDGEPAEEELRLRQPRLPLGEPQEDGARAIVGLLLDLVAREREVRVLVRRAQLDDLLELRLRLAEVLLRAQDLGQRQVRADVLGRQLHGALRGRERLCRLIRADQPLGELRPQEGRVRIALDRLLQQRDGVLDAPALHEELRGRVVVVRLGPRIPRERRARAGRIAVLAPGVARQRRAAGEGERREEESGDAGPGHRDASRA